ncbi:MAG: DUF6580 family putative transport protein [Planctomycetaceae bacterium]
MNRRGIIILSVLILFPAVWRMTDHPWNFAPVGALALFCGTYFRRKSWGLFVPLAAMVLSDVAMGWQKGDWNYAFHQTQPVVYACFALYACIGFGLRSFWSRSTQSNEPGGNRRASWQTKAVSVPCGALCGAIAFFLITNLAVWWVFYAHTWVEFVACYNLAMPYFRTTLQGDLFFVVVFFGAYELVRGQLPALQTTKFLYAD